MAKYEYRVVDVEEIDSSLLNKEGEIGWELVTAVPITKTHATSEYFTLIFIRRRIN